MVVSTPMYMNAANKFSTRSGAWGKQDLEPTSVGVFGANFSIVMVRKDII